VSARELEVRREDRRAVGRVEDGVARVLVPRPLSPAAAPLRVLESALVAALAGGEPEPVGAPQPTAWEAEALRGLLAAGYVHWRVEMRESASTDGVGGAELEVLDTGGGLRLLGFHPPEVELAPASATAVFRRLAALVSGPKRSEGATG